MMRDSKSAVTAVRSFAPDLVRSGKLIPGLGSTLLQRASAALVVALLLGAVAFLHPDRKLAYEFLLSAVLICLVAGSAALPWSRIPQWTRVFPPLAYLLSVAILIPKVGIGDIELVPLLLPPVVWTSLSLGRRTSAGVAGATALALVAMPSPSVSTFP